jgi:hypothetical protein
MKNKNFFGIISLIFIAIFSVCIFSACNQAETTTHNLQTEADKFNIYRRMTFVNLQTNDLLYEVEVYFSLQTTYENEYQGQQEIAIVIKVAPNEFKMHYFSIDNNVAYVIEQLENTNTNPYYWNIVWYITLPSNVGG